jgi:hypothetical protein
LLIVTCRPHCLRVAPGEAVLSGAVDGRHVDVGVTNEMMSIGRAVLGTMGIREINQSVGVQS